MRSVAASRYDPPSSECPEPVRSGERGAEPDKRAPGTSLVVLASPPASAQPPTRWARPSAMFLAQLIATRLAAPQTRARRRAELGEAHSAYATAARAPARNGDCGTL